MLTNQVMELCASLIRAQGGQYQVLHIRPRKQGVHPIGHMWPLHQNSILHHAVKIYTALQGSTWPVSFTHIPNVCQPPQQATCIVLPTTHPYHSQSSGGKGGYTHITIYTPVPRSLLCPQMSTVENMHRHTVTMKHPRMLPPPAPSCLVTLVHKIFMPSDPVPSGVFKCKDRKVRPPSASHANPFRQQQTRFNSLTTQGRSTCNNTYICSAVHQGPQSRHICRC